MKACRTRQRGPLKVIREKAEDALYGLKKLNKFNLDQKMILKMIVKKLEEEEEDV